MNILVLIVGEKFLASSITESFLRMTRSPSVSYENGQNRHSVCAQNVTVSTPVLEPLTLYLVLGDKG
jgi:hypothetical protein